MKLTNTLMSAVMLLGLSVVLTGCGGGSELPGGETGTVRGKVTYNGGAVPAGTTVVFMRDEDGLMGNGVVDGNGEYVLRMRDGLKIVVGVYRVSVTPPGIPANMDQDEIMRLGQEGKLPDPTKVKEVPEKYRSPEGSSLVYDVQPGSNTYDIDMKD